MRPSSIELERYFVTDLNISTNTEFDNSKPTGLTIRDLVTEPECYSEKADRQHWMIRLKVRNTDNKERNTPYFFSIEIAGFFSVVDSVPEDRVADFVKINGASILFGTAREVLRNAMSLGPYAPILLPAVCFLDAMPEAGSLPSKTAVQTAVMKRKTPARRKAVTKQKSE